MSRPTNRLSRRHFIATGLSTAVATGLPGSALALTDARARALVDQVVHEINKVIASGKSQSAMIADFERIFSRYADVNVIAQSTLGPDSRRVSSGQLRAYTTALRGYVARKYGKRFREFIGGKIEVHQVRKVKSWHEVSSTVQLRGSSPFDVRFLVSDRSGKDLFFDLIVEGVSLLISERTEIGAMLDRRKGNIDALISDLKTAG